MLSSFKFTKDGVHLPISLIHTSLFNSRISSIEYYLIEPVLSKLINFIFTICNASKIFYGRNSLANFILGFINCEVTQLI